MVRDTNVADQITDLAVQGLGDLGEPQELRQMNTGFVVRQSLDIETDGFGQFPSRHPDSRSTALDRRANGRVLVPGNVNDHNVTALVLLQFSPLKARALESQISIGLQTGKQSLSPFWVASNMFPRPHASAANQTAAKSLIR